MSPFWLQAAGHRVHSALPRAAGRPDLEAAALSSRDGGRHGGGDCNEAQKMGKRTENAMENMEVS